MGRALLITLSLVALAGCPTLDAGQPIALLPGHDWTGDQVTLLRRAAECWNMEFGTQITVSPAEVVAQQVEVNFSDFVCIYAAGRTEVNLPVSIQVCPPRSFYRQERFHRPFLFTVLVHELGHVLNIRLHADDYSVMAAGSELDKHGFGFPMSFSPTDRRMFFEQNEGFDGAGTCTVKIDSYYSEKIGCSCF